jgi:DNA modification methylase
MDKLNRCLLGDCRDVMRQLIAGGVQVQTIVTSPPYYGLRNYQVKGQLGLEETPQQYIEAMVEVFTCAWDLLADDGTLWLNIGDSYNGSGKGAMADGTVVAGGKQATNKGTTIGTFKKTDVQGLKNKDLIGIPWMLAFALRADGWYLRQDIIWAKPNPMPESVQDRCTKSHEYLFLLTKSPKYFYDNDAIKYPATSTDTSNRNRDETRLNNTPGRSKMAGLKKNDYTMANKKSVWTISTQPCSDAHFAVMPEALVEPCILAGSRIGDIVFDPFMGSGTVGKVAQALGRKWLGAELNPDYIKIQHKRTAQHSIEFTV